MAVTKMENKGCAKGCLYTVLLIVVLIALPFLVFGVWNRFHSVVQQRVIMEYHHEVLYQYLIERYGEGHDLYISDTNFTERALIDGRPLGPPLTSFRLRSESREHVEFAVSVSDDWGVQDSFWTVMRQELDIYLQNEFVAAGAQHIHRLWGSTSYVNTRQLYENDEWAGLDTAIYPTLFSAVRISIHTTLYWIEDIELMAQRISEWEVIGRNTGMSIQYYWIYAVTKCPDPVPCTSPSWWCSHPDDIGSIILTPYQIQNYNLVEVLETHIEDWHKWLESEENR